MAEVEESALSRDSLQTQPQNAIQSVRHQDVSSDPSSSSNSTTMTYSPTHTMSYSTQSDTSPTPAGENQPKFHSAKSSAPSSPENELRQVAAVVAAAASGGPTSAPFDAAAAATPRPQQKSRARSSSSGMLARLTSRSSSYLSDHLIDTGSTITSHDSVDSFTKPKLDRTALAKPKGKYKSGVNWDSSVMNLAAGEEPFMEQISSLHNVSKEEGEDVLKSAELEQMAAAGSTKAALAWSRANSFGDPVFATHRRATADSPINTTNLQGLNTPITSTSARLRPLSVRAPLENNRASVLRYSGNEMNGISEDAGSKGEESSREGSQSLHSHDLISGIGQQVLVSARKAAADSQDAQEKQSSNEIEASKVNDVNQAAEAQRVVKQAKRRTFLGFGGTKKEKKTDKSNAVSEQLGEDEIDGSINVADFTGQSNRDEEARSVNNGTSSRKRRFNDTRQLDLLANELAAEALMGASDNYSHVMPQARRASMMSMLAATNADPAGVSSNTSSQVNLQPNGFNHLAMPQPAFATDFFRSNSPGGTGNSSRSGSPRFMGSDSPKYDPPRAPYARSQRSNSSSNTPIASQKANLTGLPVDMLTGLGDGPYPSMFFREREMSEPGVMPASMDGMEDQQYYQQGNRSANGDAFTSRSRLGSASSAPMTKRSVLQMSMHNPGSEMQGLTKPPKSTRSTPFGSRAPSKQVTPQASYSNLRDKGNAAISPTLLSNELEKSEQSLKDIRIRGEVQGEEAAIASSNVPNSNNKSNTVTKEIKGNINGSGIKGSRRSLFGKKSKSKLLETEGVSKDNRLSPPKTESAPKAQSLHSSNGGSNGLSSIGNRLLAASRSAHNLVKMPSPTQSNATTSASSHERGAFRSSSEAGSQQQGFSTVTTPEALPAKLDLTNMPPNEVSLPAIQSTPPVLPPVINSTFKPTQTSTLSPNPRSMSAASKSTTSTVGRINKLKSIFGSKPSFSATPTSDEKSVALNVLHMSNGSPSPNEVSKIKFFHNRTNGKVIV